MSRREEKRERASCHDSRRWLKYHPPRCGDPLFGLGPEEDWAAAVGKAIRRYPAQVRRREDDLRAGGVGAGRRGRSAEDVALRSLTGPTAAVEKAMDHFHRGERERLCAVLWGGASRIKSDRAQVALFHRYVAVYLGYGRRHYDLNAL